MGLKIAFIGQKGIPATFGGVESHVEELAKRLVTKGHEVTVYVRDWYTPRDLKQHNGARLIHTPTIKTKHLDAFIHSFTSSSHALVSRYDIVHYHAIGPSIFSWLPKLAGKKVVVTIHRFDYEADKWGWFAKCFLKAAEKVALTVPHSTFVVAKYQQEHYSAQGFKEVVYIPNGVNIAEPVAPQIITEKYGLKGHDYLLSLGRLSPEKRIEWIIDDYLSLAPNNVKLVVAGGSSATDEYVQKLHRLAAGNSSIIFTSYVSGRLKMELFSNAYAFIIPSALEGLPIALLEAMSYGLPCIASGIPPHMEVIQHNLNGYIFDPTRREDLKNQLRYVLKSSPSEIQRIRMTAKEFVYKEYNWERIVDKIEKLYYKLVGT